LLIKGVVTVATVIREYWSLIILIKRIRATALADSSQTDTAGDPSAYEPRFGSAVSFAPTAIDFIRQHRWSTMDTMMSETHLTELTPSITSPEDACTIAEQIRDGKFDMNSISMAEWLQIAFLLLYHGELINIDQKVMYGGAMFNLHACLDSANPAEETKILRTKQ